MKLNLKKAAMFGLDARIALVIFGSLSIISGASLYSAIKSANMEQVRQLFETVIKAEEQYYLDTRQRVPQFSGNDYHLRIASLTSNMSDNLPTWKGPYIEGTSIPVISIRNSSSKRISEEVYLELRLSLKSDWTTSATKQICVIDNQDCTEYVVLMSENTDIHPLIVSLFEDLDKYIDNEDGPLKGKVRLNEGKDLYYMGISRQRRI